MEEIGFRDFQPEDAAWLAARHGALYAEEEGFDESFPALVAQILADYLAAHDPMRERGWIAVRGGERLGSVFCVTAPDGRAKLRLFLVERAARGQGLGRRMLDLCLRYARDRAYSGLTLWTHESHRAACALYRAAGLRIVESKAVRSFGQDLVEQIWQVDF
jgi:GNAT superfamily N-acetyltransferase